MIWKNEQRDGKIIGAITIVKPYQLTVNHYVGRGKAWFAGCQGLFWQVNLGEIPLEKAKEQALEILHEKLKASVEEIENYWISLYINEDLSEGMLSNLLGIDRVTARGKVQEYAKENGIEL